MKIMVTGAGGSMGSFMAEYLLETQPDAEIVGITRSGNRDNLRSVLSNPKFRFVQVDLTSISRVFSVFRDHQPDYIFHFASDANVRRSFNNPYYCIKNNITSTLNLFEAVRRFSPHSKIMVSSTSEVYGSVDKKDVPIKETQLQRPVNPYSASKLSQEAIALSYYRSFNIPVIITRAFSYINPRRADLFSTSFANRIIEIERGFSKFLTHGYLDSVRSFVDARDITEAYWLAITKCNLGEVYNIGSSEALSVGDVLDKLIERSHVTIDKKVDEDLIRPVDITNQIPDVSKFIKFTGWKPKYSLDESLDYLLDYCRRTD